MTIERGRHYTLAEAARLVGRSATTLRHHVSTGKLTATLRGKTWIVTGRALQRYVEQTRQRDDQLAIVRRPLDPIERGERT